MGDEYCRDAHFSLDSLQLDLHLDAQRLVQGAQRLVEQKHPRPYDDGAGKCDALSLPAGQLVRLPAFKALQTNEFKRLAHPAGLFSPGNLSNGQAEADVSCDTHIREKGVVLEHHAHVPLFNAEFFNRLARNGNAARCREIEARDQPEQRRFPAA